MGQKRQHEQKPAGRRFNKKKKTGKPQDGKKDAVDQIVAIDDLNWKEATLPDRLDDAEGFYGLEEVEGVDIVRSDGGGEVQFKVCLRLVN